MKVAVKVPPSPFRLLKERYFGEETRDPRVALEVVYMDCAPAVLIRRFSETRRRHPLAPNETPAQGVEREIDLLAPIRVRADHLIDTTELTQHDLKAGLACSGVSQP